MRDRFFNWTMAATCVVFAALSAVSMWATKLYFDPMQVAGRMAILVPVAGFLFGMAAYAKSRGVDSIKNLSIVLAWTFVIGEIHVIPMFAVPRTGVPFRDDLLARVDHAIGVDLPTVVNWVARHPTFRAFSGYCYGSLFALCLLPGLIPPLAGDSASSRRFIVAVVAFAAISFPIMCLFQAVGPWAYYGYKPQINQDSYMAMLTELRTSHRVLLDFDYDAGLICFPSYHTSAAVLAAAALWSTPYLRWIAAAWAGLIVVSTVTTGSHYVADVVAALALCVAAQLVAHGYSRMENMASREPLLSRVENPSSNLARSCVSS